METGYRNSRLDSLIPIAAVGMVVMSGWSGTKLSSNSQPQNHQKTGELAELFSTKKSLGSIAVGHAEGNMTADGKATALTNGHTDPGNLAYNRGFCSWNKANGLSLEQADANCLSALQQQSQAIISDLKAVGVTPTIELVINGTDLSNQSPRAGQSFAAKYRDAVKANHPNPILHARITAFEPKPRTLSASGLFRICRTYKHYRSQLAGLRGYDWQYKCIGLDQGRRVTAISETLSIR